MLRDRSFDEEACPVSDHVLGELYRSSPHGLGELIATVSPEARAMLALYCYRRAHLASIGLAIAASCEEDDLSQSGGNAGRMLFMKSREAPETPHANAYSGRRKITLASGTLRQMGQIDDELED